MWHSYQVHGFRMRSDFLFPLTPCEEASSPNLTFTLHSGRPALTTQLRSWTLLAERRSSPTYGVELYQGEDGHLLREIAGNDGIADYYLSADGQQVTCYQDVGMPREQIWGFFLAIGMAFLLQQRGWIVLHSSAVAYHGGVVAFLAFSGVGKQSSSENVQAADFHLRKVRAKERCSGLLARLRSG